MPSENWESIGVVTEQEPIFIGGVNLWDHQWTPLKEPRVTLPHPSYPSQRHEMSIYEIKTRNESVKFAAGELSNGVYGFYMLTKNN